MIEQALREIGLTSNETRIYLALLELGPSLASAITAKTNLNRSDVYDRLDKLIKKGLVSFVIKNNRKYFQAVSPESLLNYVQEKEEEFKQKEQKIRSILPELQKIGKTVKEKLEVSLYKDNAGIKTVLEDILATLRKGDELLAYGSDVKFYDVLRFYYPHFVKRRIKAGIRLKCILSEENRIALDLSDIRYVPKKYHLPVGTAIYADKVVIFLLKETPIAILIVNKDIAEGYRSYFRWLWVFARKK